MLDPRPPILRLPVELLSYVAEYLGPPDLARAEPGWLVFPAVCRLWRDVAHRLLEWESGEIDEWTEYAQIDLLPQHYLVELNAHMTTLGHPSTTLLSGTVFGGHESSAFWGIRPIWTGGAVDYVDGCLAVFTTEADDASRHDVNTYLSQPLYGLRFPWVTSITITLPGPAVIDEPNFTFADAPFIDAPALRMLHLMDYVLDWSCHHLQSLNIVLRNLENAENRTRYCYPPARLVELMSDSRLTLEDVILYNCIPSVEDTPTIPAVFFPRVHDVLLHGGVAETWWIRQSMALRAHVQPTFTTYPHVPCGEVLRSFAWEYAKSTVGWHGDSGDDHGSHAAIGMLSFHKSTSPRIAPDESRCVVKAYATGVCAEAVASQLIVDSAGIDAPEGEDSQLHSRFRPVAGGATSAVPEPVFVVNLRWNTHAWDSADDLPDRPHRTSLASVTDIFVHEDEGETESLFAEDINGTMTWAMMLLHFPTLRHMHITAASGRSLWPVRAPDAFFPTLETLWLRGADSASPHELDVREPLLILIRRLGVTREFVPGGEFTIRLENVCLVGDEQLVKQFWELNGTGWTDA
ncbi:unnamed protein product [Peniophora sp. CBMAI 1063]|nr:unnamed protein product [Peniophora sp. CBMAI 1063]